MYKANITLLLITMIYTQPSFSNEVANNYKVDVDKTNTRISEIDTELNNLYQQKAYIEDQVDDCLKKAYQPPSPVTCNGNEIECLLREGEALMSGPQQAANCNAYAQPYITQIEYNIAALKDEKSTLKAKKRNNLD